MAVRKTIFTLLCVCFIMACHNKKEVEEEVITTEYVHLSSEEETPPPPPPGLTSTFKSLEEWLTQICNEEKPVKPIDTYNFGLFESPKTYTLYLVGTNTYNREQNHSQTRIEFEPTHMYFTLPEDGYKHQNRESVLKHLTAALKDFTRTEKFKHSFLTKAKTITTDFNGVIWSK